MNWTLLKKELKSNFSLQIIFMSVLTVYGAAIIPMFDPKLADSLKQMMQTMPKIFEIVGMREISADLTDFLINYLYAFLLIAIPLIFIILLTSRLIIRYLDKGSIACLLATPNSRKKIIATQFFCAALELLFLNIYITLLFVLVSENMFKGALNIEKLLAANVGLYALWFALIGICCFSAVLIPSSAGALWTGSGYALFSLFLQMFIRAVGEKADFLKYLSIISLFNPHLYDEKPSVFFAQTAALFLIGLTAFTASAAVFNKRDIQA